MIGGFILAAGEGRRLRPATLSRPKALVPFCGVPALELVAARLADVGLNGIVVNCCYLADQVAGAAASLSVRHGWDLRLSLETQLLGTGGGIRHGARLLPDVGHMLVHNVDAILDFDLSRLVDLHLQSEAAATLLLVAEKGPRTVDIEPGGRIRDFRRPAGHGRYTFTGVHLLRREVLDLLPDESPCSIITAYEAALGRGWLVNGLPIGDTGYWADLGTPQAYIRAHGEIADCSLLQHPRLRAAQAEQARRRATLQTAGVRCTGALGLGAELSVPAGAQLHNVVLWDHTRLPEPILYADGIFVGDAVPPSRRVDETREPDPRIYRCLDLVPGETTLEPLPKQGSGRRYCRLSSGDRSWVWCAYDALRRENSGFSTLADFLQRIGVLVPAVQLHLADAGELVSRDLGQHVLQVMDLSAPSRQEYLRQVAAQIARLHVVGERAARLEELPLQKGFTKGLYDWERDYFREHMLNRFLSRPTLWSSAVAQEYAELRTLLLSQTPVPIHRDLQSANIMVVDKQAYVIDFQGMRLGCAAYDLASLLYDPYQCYPRDSRCGIWDFYRGNVTASGGTPPADELLYAAAVQRLFQCLGAYGKLWLTDGLEWYRQFIVPAFRMVLAANGESDTRPAIHTMVSTCLELAEERLQARARTVSGDGSDGGELRGDGSAAPSTVATGASG